MADYVTASQLKTWLGIGDTTDDTVLATIATVASRAVDKHCRRTFSKDSVATARLYYPMDRDLLDVDDFWDTASLVVGTDEDGDGTFEVTWASTDFSLLPLSGVVNGQTGWAYSTLVAIGDRSFPLQPWPSVSVTAKWGWTAVPDDVYQATLLLGSRLFRRRQSPDGIAGAGDYGVVRVSRQQDPDVVALLAPYRKIGGVA